VDLVGELLVGRGAIEVGEEEPNNPFSSDTVLGEGV